MQLAKDESLPGPGGEHGRRSEFLKRCAVALQALSPGAETDPKKLSAEGQHKIRVALSEKEATYQGCLSEEFLDIETTWITETFGEGEQRMVCSHRAR